MVCEHSRDISINIKISLLVVNCLQNLKIKLEEYLQMFVCAGQILEHELAQGGNCWRCNDEVSG